MQLPVYLCFGSREIGFLLLSTHLLAALTVGIIFRNWKKNKDDLSRKFLQVTKNKPTISFSNLGEILGESIKSSINLILTIGGFIVLFSVIISIFNTLGIFTGNPIFAGILELTNGLKLSNDIVMSSVILGFGGLSIMLQVYSVISKYGLSIKPYLYGKCLQAIFAGIYTFIALQAFPI